VLDPVADLKLHQLDLVEAIHERQALLQARAAAPRRAQSSPGAPKARLGPRGGLPAPVPHSAALPMPLCCDSTCALAPGNFLVLFFISFRQS